MFSRLRGTGGEGPNAGPGVCYFEWNMGPVNNSIEDTVFLDAWAVFLDKVGAGATAVDMR